MKESNYPVEFRIKIALDTRTAKIISNEFGVPMCSVQYWRNKFNPGGKFNRRRFKLEPSYNGGRVITISEWLSEVNGNTHV